MCSETQLIVVPLMLWPFCHYEVAFFIMDITLLHCLPCLISIQILQISYLIIIEKTEL